MKERRVRKSSEKSSNNIRVGSGKTVAAYGTEDDGFSTSHRADDLQQSPVPAAATSQQRPAASGKVCRRYQRRRELQSATNERDSASSRLGIASNLL